MQSGEETKQVDKMEVKKINQRQHCAGAGYILPSAGKAGITGIPLAGNY